MKHDEAAQMSEILFSPGTEVEDDVRVGFILVVGGCRNPVK